ncbi:hypothetical protein BH24ACT5_BH24ACT5_21810 [soil metagenome]
MAIPAGFVAMVMPHLRHRLGLLAGVLGAGICLTLVPFAPAGIPVLGAVAAILIGLPGRDPSDSAGADIPTEPLPL